MLVAENRKGSVISKHENNTVLFQRKIIALIRTTWHQATDNCFDWAPLSPNLTAAEPNTVSERLSQCFCPFKRDSDAVSHWLEFPHTARELWWGRLGKAASLIPWFSSRPGKYWNTHTQRLFRVQLPQAELKARLYRWLAGEEGSTLKFQPLTSVGYQYYLQFRFGHPEF